MSNGNFATRLFSALWTGVDGLRKVLHLVVLLFLFSIVISALSSSSVTVPASAALVIQPEGSLVEQLAGNPFDRALQELMGDAQPQTLVRDIVNGLEYAKDDSRIKLVVLDLSGMPSGGLSKLKQVAEAIDSFRESGKPVIATSNYYGQGAYYLASHADEVIMHPEGILVLSGFGAYQNFYKGALDKLKIDWNIFRVGTYKAAVEPYMREDMSPEYRESIRHVLDQLWQQYMRDIEEARGLDEGTVAELMDSLVDRVRAADGNLAQIALDAGFVDALMTRDQLRTRIIETAGTTKEGHDYPSASLAGYLQQMDLLHGDKSDDSNVAVVVAAGEILDGNQPPGTIGGDSTASLLRQARFDDSVKSVVFRVDSPGGSAFASEVILNEVQALKAAGKPVVVSMSSVAASGGYWVSMAADRIFASPYTITGSIGIFGMFPTFQRSLDAVGISTDGVGTTIWSGELRPDRAMSDDMKAVFQLAIESGYEDFISRVATNRGMTRDAVDNIGQGRIWTAGDAYDNGLIDELGGLDDAIAAAAELAGLSTGEYGYLYIEPTLDPTEQLMLDLMSGASNLGLPLPTWHRTKPSLERVAGLLEDALSPLVRFNDPGGMYSHCFCDFN